MRRILLIYDDFSEMMETHNGLKKVGFDVVAVTNELSTTDQVVTFNPDMVISSGRNIRIAPLGVARRLADLPRWKGLSVVIIPANHQRNPEDLMKTKVDQLLQGPIPFENLLSVVCKFFNLDETLLLTRLNRTFVEEAESVSLVRERAIDPRLLAGPGKESDEVQSTNAQLSAKKGLSRIQEAIGVKGKLPVPEATESKGTAGTLETVGSLESSQSSNAIKPQRSSKNEEENQLKSKKKSPKESLFESFASGPGADEESNLTDLPGPKVFDAKSKRLSTQAILSEIQAAREREKEKIKRYLELSKKLAPSMTSALERVSTKKELKKMARSWPKADLEAQDRERAAFVETLFKRKA